LRHHAILRTLDSYGNSLRKPEIVRHHNHAPRAATCAGLFNDIDLVTRIDRRVARPPESPALHASTLGQRDAVRSPPIFGDAALADSHHISRLPSPQPRSYHQASARRAVARMRIAPSATISLAGSGQCTDVALAADRQTAARVA